MAAALNRGIKIKEDATGPSVPPLLPLDTQAKAGVAACNAAGQGAFRALLQSLVTGLLAAAAAPPPSPSPLLTQFEAAGGAAALGAARSLASEALLAAVRSGREAGDLARALGAMGLQEALAGDLAGVAAGQRAALLPLLEAALPRHPGLARLRWRLDVALSSASLAKVMRTVILAELTLTSGRVVTMEVPADKFAELRYSVAKALQEMGAIENHPVLRI